MATRRKAKKRTTKRATKRTTRKVAAKRTTKRKSSSKRSDVQIAFAAARKHYGGKIPKGTKLARFMPKGSSSSKKGNPGGSSRRSSNPGRRRGGSMFKGLGGVYVDGALNTIPVMGGKIAARALPVMLKFGVPKPGKPALDPLFTLATELAVGALGAWAIDMFGYKEWGRLFFTGSALAVAESAAKRYNVPGAEFLCDGTDVLAGYTYELGNVENLSAGELARLYGAGGANMMGRHMGLYPGTAFSSYPDTEYAT